VVITAVVVEGRRPGEVAAAYGVARSWVYELVARYRAEGDTALEPRSRRPHTSLRIRWLAAHPAPPTITKLQTQIDDFLTHYNGQRPHRSLSGRTPTAAYHARPKATARGTHHAHYRIRHDRVSHGNVSLRLDGQLHHIGLGRHLHRTPVIMLIADLDGRVIHATTGELLRQLTINPQRRYHGTGNPIGGPRRPYGPRKRRQPEP
jgi:hypothetical protein